MAKPKSPLLSLGARGTIGDALTYQKRGREHIVRQKPVPRDPHSLNQAYQRWDYRDYAYLWTLLTNSEKQIYRTKASRYHITGFSQWMREKLKDLPTIVARWRLDEKAGAIAYDSSKNTNNLIIIGASPATGLINGCSYLDGLNDYLRIDANPTLYGMSEITIEFFFRVAQLGVWQALIDFRTASGVGAFLLWVRNNNLLHCAAQSGVGASVMTPGAVSVDTWYHGLWTAKDGENARLFLDGVKATGTAMVGSIQGATPRLTLGTNSYNFTSKLKGNLDHVIIYKQVFTDELAIKHSLRRYPA